MLGREDEESMLIVKSIRFTLAKNVGEEIRKKTSKAQQSILG